MPEYPANQISIDFNLSIVIVKLAMYASISGKDRKTITNKGTYNFHGPQVVLSTVNVPIALAPSLSHQNRIDFYQEEFTKVGDQLDAYLKEIDSKCAHIVVTYFPNKKEDESITDSCQKVFGKATGFINYAMYTGAVDSMHNLDKLLAQRSMENGGAP